MKLVIQYLPHQQDLPHHHQPRRHHARLNQQVTYISDVIRHLQVDSETPIMKDTMKITDLIKQYRFAAKLFKQNCQIYYDTFRSLESGFVDETSLTTTMLSDIRNHSEIGEVVLPSDYWIYTNVKPEYLSNTGSHVVFKLSIPLFDKRESFKIFFFDFFEVFHGKTTTKKLSEPQTIAIKDSNNAKHFLPSKHTCKGSKPRACIVDKYSAEESCLKSIINFGQPQSCLYTFKESSTPVFTSRLTHEFILLSSSKKGTIREICINETVDTSYTGSIVFKIKPGCVVHTGNDSMRNAMIKVAEYDIPYLNFMFQKINLTFPEETSLLPRFFGKKRETINVKKYAALLEKDDYMPPDAIFKDPHDHMFLFSTVQTVVFVLIVLVFIYMSCQILKMRQHIVAAKAVAHD